MDRQGFKRRPAGQDSAGCPDFAGVTPNEPGLTRVRRGNGFSYKRGTAPRSRRRARSSGSPRSASPGLEGRLDLRDARGHIQATGVDAAAASSTSTTRTGAHGRDRDEVRRDDEFARALPELRGASTRDLRRMASPASGSCRRRAPAGPGLFRSAASATPMRTRPTASRRSASPTSGSSGDARSSTTRPRAGSAAGATVADPGPAPRRQLKRRRGGGEELLAFRTAGAGATCARATSTRTSRSVAAASLGQGLPHLERDRARCRRRSPTLDEAAETKAAPQARDQQGGQAGRRLPGQHPAVCRSSYIDPRVFDRYQVGTPSRAT